MKFNEFYKDGFVLSPFYSGEDFDKYDKVEKIVLSKEDLRGIVTKRLDENIDILFAEDALVFIKYPCRYHITPQDLIERFQNELDRELGPEYESVIALIKLSTISDNDGPVFAPRLNDKCFLNIKDGISDYLFEKDDHIVSFVLAKVLHELKENNIEEVLLKYIDFIKDVLSQKNYSKDKKIFDIKTYSLIIDSIATETYKGKKLPLKVEEFYRRQLSINAKNGDNSSMRILGYEYYEGTNGFPLDPNKSLYWLEKYYNATNDPDVASSIGYIYYYGRTTNGVPQGDKAFQYFAIGHIAGRYYEATYKLADCYLKGYGTPVCHQAAYNLVNGIYEETQGFFLKGADSKFADVALRLGNYYKDGIFVKKDLNQAHLLLLEAKVAIKKRLENMEYVGDRSVAMAISTSLEEVEKELNIDKRIINDGGYLLQEAAITFSNPKFKMTINDGVVDIVIKRNKDDEYEYYLSNVASIGFAERSKEVVLRFTPLSIEDATGFIKCLKMYDVKEITFVENRIYALLDMEDGETFPAFISYTDLIIYPQTLKNISQKYLVASLELYPGSKLYDYICLDNNVEVGDIIEIAIKGEKKQATVKTIKYLYEDQLPLPIKKMEEI